MKIFIRADGGRGIGLGHIMRMLVLADELKKENDVIFICRQAKDNRFEAGIRLILKNDFKTLYIKEENFINDIISIQKDYKADMLITDSYEVSEAYFDILTHYFRITGYVDDVNSMKMNVDFIINQNINAHTLDYSKNTNKKTKLFLGPQYCMIRKEFTDAFKDKKIKKEVSDIMVTLGGMDDKNNTLKILQIIKSVHQNIHVVLGSAFSKKTIKDIEILSVQHRNIHLYKNANMSGLMKKCDIAISSCGSTLYELCSMNVPSIGIVIADNQKYSADFMKNNNLIADVFDIEEINIEKFKKSINTLINNSDKRNEIIQRQKGTININGAANLAEKIVNEFIKVKKN